MFGLFEKLYAFCEMDEFELDSFQENQQLLQRDFAQQASIQDLIIKNRQLTKDGLRSRSRWVNTTAVLIVTVLIMSVAFVTVTLKDKAKIKELQRQAAIPVLEKCLIGDDNKPICSLGKDKDTNLDYKQILQLNSPIALDYCTWKDGYGPVFKDLAKDFYSKRGSHSDGGRLPTLMQFFLQNNLNIAYALYRRAENPVYDAWLEKLRSGGYIPANGISFNKKPEAKTFYAYDTIRIKSQRNIDLLISYFIENMQQELTTYLNFAGKNIPWPLIDSDPKSKQFTRKLPGKQKDMSAYKPPKGKRYNYLQLVYFETKMPQSGGFRARAAKSDGCDNAVLPADETEAPGIDGRLNLDVFCIRNRTIGFSEPNPNDEPLPDSVLYDADQFLDVLRTADFFALETNTPNEKKSFDSATTALIKDQAVVALSVFCSDFIRLAIESRIHDFIIALRLAASSVTYNIVKMGYENNAKAYEMLYSPVASSLYKSRAFYNFPMAQKFLIPAVMACTYYGQINVPFTQMTNVNFLDFGILTSKDATCGRCEPPLMLRSVSRGNVLARLSCSRDNGDCECETVTAQSMAAIEKYTDEYPERILEKYGLNLADWNITKFQTAMYRIEYTKTTNVQGPGHICRIISNEPFIEIPKDTPKEIGSKERECTSYNKVSETVSGLFCTGTPFPETENLKCPPWPLILTDNGTVTFTDMKDPEFYSTNGQIAEYGLWCAKAGFRCLVAQGSKLGVTTALESMGNITNGYYLGLNIVSNDTACSCLKEENPSKSDLSCYKMRLYPRCVTYPEIYDPAAYVNRTLIKWITTHGLHRHTIRYRPVHTKNPGEYGAIVCSQQLEEISRDSKGIPVKNHVYPPECPVVVGNKRDMLRILYQRRFHDGVFFESQIYQEIFNLTKLPEFDSTYDWRNNYRGRKGNVFMWNGASGKQKFYCWYKPANKVFDHQTTDSKDTCPPNIPNNVCDHKAMQVNPGTYVLVCSSYRCGRVPVKVGTWGDLTYTLQETKRLLTRERPHDFKLPVYCSITLKCPEITERGRGNTITCCDTKSSFDQPKNIKSQRFGLTYPLRTFSRGRCAAGRTDNQHWSKAAGRCPR